MPYNTRNPVGPNGSSDPRDLFDNSGIADVWTTDREKMSHPDRMGVPRKTWAGMESEFQSAQDQRRAQFEAMQALQAQQFETAQDARVNEFNEFILSSGYETPVDYAPGLIITRLTQIVRYDGELYRPKDSAIPFTTTTFENDEAKWVANGDNSLRQDLKFGSGEMVGFKSTLAGAVRTNLALLGASWMDVRAVFGAIGDGQYHPLSDLYGSLAAAQFQYPNAGITSLSQSIDWAAIKSCAATGRVCYGSSAKYVINDWVIFPSGSGFVGDGSDRYTPYAPSLVNDDNGTHVLLYSNAELVHEVRHISNADTSGGVLANPSAADPYTASAPVPRYSLQDFTNADAVGVTPATSRKFSAGFVAKNAARVKFQGFRIIPWNGEGGQGNYKLSSSVDLGARWDMGIWLHNTTECLVSDVQAVGYYRMAAICKTISADVDFGVSQGESDHFCRNTMQGFAGFLSRSYDLHRVVAVGPSSISIPWSASHQFPASGSVRVQGVDKTYTGLSFDGANLVFTGIDPSGVTTSSELRIAGSSFGSSGTVLIDNYINSLGHHSLLPATSPLLKESDGSQAWTNPSTAIEISGEPNRGYYFTNNTFISNDDRMVHFHNSRDMDFSGNYFEAKEARSALNSSLNMIPAGARWIATRQSAGLVPAPAGYTSNLRSRGHTDNGAIDMRPVYDAYPSGKYLTGGGLFYPREVQIDKYNQPVLAGGRMQTISELGNVELISRGGDVGLRHSPSGDVTVGNEAGTLASLRSVAASFFLKCLIRLNIGNTAGDVWYTADSTKFYGVGGSRELGLPTSAWSKSYVTRRYWTATVWDGVTNVSSPEGVETGGVGSTCRSLITGRLWEKTSGTGNTGWVLVQI